MLVKISVPFTDKHESLAWSLQLLNALKMFSSNHTVPADIFAVDAYCFT